MKPAATLIDGRHGHIAPETRLWTAVVIRAVADAMLVDLNPDGHPRELLNGSVYRYELARIRDEARIWLLYDREGFCRACDMAGLDWQAVRAGARRLIEGAAKGARDKLYAWAAYNRLDLL